MSDVFFEQSDFTQKRITIKEKVERLIREHPECKNDYRKLIRYFWYYEDGLKEFIPFEKFQQLTQPESITRAFREICNIKRRVEPPSEIVQEARQTEEQNYHTYYSRKKRENEFI